MMSEHWTDRLSEYLDGELPAAEARRLEAHTASCAACAGTLRELREIVETAASLPSRDAEVPADRDLWPEIARRLSPRTAEGLAVPVISLAARRGGGRRVTFSVPQLAAAGLALVLFSASGVWLALGGGSAPPSTAAPAVDPPAAAASATFTASWEAAIEELEGEFERRRAELAPGTIQVVERNLAIIDQAISEARRALESDPSSTFLNAYMAEAMRKKVDLLRQATRIHRTET